MDLKVLSEWININDLTSLAVGTDLMILNKGHRRLTIQEKTTQPASDNTEGAVISHIDAANNVSYITGATSNTWVRCMPNESTMISVLEVL